MDPIRRAASISLCGSLLFSFGASAQARATVTGSIDQRASKYSEIAQTIWELAEVGYLEQESSALLQTTLSNAGFQIEAGVAGIPTAFVATAGSGGPVISILAEYDALPGITQDRVPHREPMIELGAGHACGHHLFGTGSAAAAIAVKEWLEQSGTPGTIRVYGTPAEEGGAGKVYMVRAGLFDDVDVAIHWHPGDRNSAAVRGTLANKSAKFRFRGISAHAAAAPWRARSALDAVESMNYMVNMMREHVPQETRIHYVITSGGAAPNVTPDFAEVWYYVRHPEPNQVLDLFERVVDASEGAALGTGTDVDHEIIHGVYAMLPNETLARVMHRNLSEVGGVTYSPADRQFAEVIRTTFTGSVPSIESAAQVQEFEINLAATGGSTDVADVSWAVPTVGLSAATWVPGTAAHSWQAVAAGGTEIGNKGMLVAAKTMALTAVELFSNQDLIAEAQREHLRRVGPDFVYTPLVGDRDPPLDYRKPAGQR